MNGDRIFGVLAVLIAVAFLVAVACILLKTRPTWTTDLPGATCAAHVGDEDYRCVDKGIVYLCIDNYGTHHISCGKFTVQP